MEPRAPAPARRLGAIAALAAAGIPVRVMVAPVIPVLTEPELESILEAARDAGAAAAGYDPPAPAARGGAAVPRLARPP